ncbi:methyl-accepting chemotaxis protein [Rhodopseudomonas pseudopalustris]|uniref:Methyl-accepting chemotaxis sensory transducer n=2 Tax=Rhodopseudomonas TaxID=1073 RepID=Q139Z7_RHOPS|nr:methyl-accepting chemotaxis protein [Rhodopseudomonas pseudopalustris]ABE39092.1 methyl-accepting chemotaxis sensory transducer [Rhodopseudomonas palustris BisB5]SEO70452.1 methyl-accepting chemotaxis sensory transducer [Rhodopseudomonas pseudopalustris]
MFDRLSIRSKITIVLTVLLVTMSSLGGLALLKMQAINTTSVDLASNWLPSVRALGELRAAGITYRNVIRQHMLSFTVEDKQAMEKSLETVKVGLAKARATYEAMIVLPEERALYNQWSQIWDEYVRGAEQVIAKSRVDIGKVSQEAADFNAKTVNPIAVRADEVLQKDIDLNNKGGDDASKTAADTFRSALYLVVGILAFAAIAGLGLGVMLVRDVSRNIASIIETMQALGRGDLTATVPHRGEKTEIGSMADVLQVFKEALIDKKAADEAASLEAEAKIARGQRVDSITRQFESMIGEIVQTVSSASTQLEASAGSLSSTAEHSQEITTLVASASEEASNNVQSVASATEEMASSVNEISRQVQDSARIANEAVEQARRTNDRVGELAQAATRIGDVVELINTIAGQTNLLALNATIEAARAGEAGRGFAVVASEVKALAEQTAKATGEISQQITGIQAATQDSVGAIKDIGDIIGRMSEIASTIASAVEEQGAATQEIARNVQQAALGTQQVSANIVDVQRGASESTAASTQVLSAAKSLSTESNRLKLEVGQFLDSVRAA